MDELDHLPTCSNRWTMCISLSVRFAVWIHSWNASDWVRVRDYGSKLDSGPDYGSGFHDCVGLTPFFLDWINSWNEGFRKMVPCGVRVHHSIIDIFTERNRLIKPSDAKKLWGNPETYSAERVPRFRCKLLICRGRSWNAASNHCWACHCVPFRSFSWGIVFNTFPH